MLSEVDAAEAGGPTGRPKRKAAQKTSIAEQAKRARAEVAESALALTVSSAQVCKPGHPPVCTIFEVSCTLSVVSKNVLHTECVTLYSAKKCLAHTL